MTGPVISRALPVAPASARPTAAARPAGPGAGSRLGKGASRRTVRQAATFGTIGVASTLAYVGLYAALRLAVDPLVSNAVALLATSVGNTAANRALTFGVRGGAHAVRDQLAGLVALGVALALTSVSVGLLGLLAPGAGRTLELVVLGLANGLATVARFLLLRRWIAPPVAAAPSQGVIR